MKAAYRLLMPEGWHRMHIADGPEDDVDSLVARVLPRERTGDGSDAVLARRRLRQDILVRLRKAADVGVVDLYLFAGSAGGIALPMSLTVSVVYLGPRLADVPLAALAEGLSNDGSAEVLAFPVGEVIRTRRTRTGTVGARRTTFGEPPSVDVSTPAVRDRVTALLDLVDRNAQRVVDDTELEYLVPIPAEPGAFAMLTFALPGPRVIDERVGHCDFIAGGFAWTGC